MKKSFILALALFCLLSLAGCGKQGTPNGQETMPNPVSDCRFSQYLDQSGFVPDLSEGDFVSQLGKYSYIGEKITDIASFYHHSALLGGGMRAHGGFFGYESEYWVTRDEKYADYTNSFYTQRALDGLALPNGIDFDDTLGEALQKLGADIDPQSGLVWDEGNAGTMTLYKDRTSTLKLTDCRLRFKTFEKPSYFYELKFTEIYRTTKKDGRDITVTRCVTLSFPDDESKLDRLDMWVSERSKLQQGDGIVADLLNQ